VDVTFELSRALAYTTFKMQVAATRYPRRGISGQKIELTVHEDPALNQKTPKREAATLDSALHSTPAGPSVTDFGAWMFQYRDSKLSKDSTEKAAQMSANKRDKLSPERRQTLHAHAHGPAASPALERLGGGRRRQAEEFDFGDDDVDDGMPKSNFRIKDEFTENSIRRSSLHLLARCDMILLAIIPPAFISYLVVMLMSLGMDQMWSSDQRVMLELVDESVVPPGGSPQCWQYMYREEQDPVLKGNNFTLLHQSACDHVPAPAPLGSMTAMAGVLMFFFTVSLMVFLHYIKACFGNVYHMTVGTGLSGRGKMAQRLGGQPTAVQPMM